MAFKFRSPVRFERLRRLLPRAHWEVARARDKRTIFAYCKKDGDFVELGVEPKSAATSKKARLEGFAEALAQGRSLRAVIDEDIVAAAMNFQQLEWMYLQSQAPRSALTNCTWVYGGGGHGKTRLVAEYVKEESAELVDCQRFAYWHKSDAFKWWSGYTGQQIVVIDDMRPDHCTVSEFCRLIDRTPLRLETKGGHVQFVAEEVIVTTIDDPQSFFVQMKGSGTEPWSQVQRRITMVVHVDSEGNEHDHTERFKCGEHFTT